MQPTFGIFCLCAFGFISCGYIGDPCIIRTTGVTGSCTLLENCPSAVQALIKGIFPQNCGFLTNYPIVCCEQGNAGVAATSELTTDKPANVVIGEKSRQMCQEYKPQEGNHISLLPDVEDVTIRTCEFSTLPLVLGGKNAFPRQYPHMAAIGFDDREDNKVWLCGGSLISEYFVLTAASCTRIRFYNEAKYVRLGDLILTTTKDDAIPQDFIITKIINHPGYRSPAVYNDLALLKLNRAAQINAYVRPACINTNAVITSDRAVVTSWTKLSFADEQCELLNEFLQFTSPEECNKWYLKHSSWLLPKGILDDMQLCAASTPSRYMCLDEHGDPLQVYNTSTCTYTIIGVASYGRPCAIEGPGIFTRVSRYVEWIESIVWP